ncbi:MULTISPECIES: hypothetical protein [unclassified Caballeronia]|uniref:hypothetical protein n=1 Tax=unclassified Caballeronia TaxID=2646786 RepID=UPI00285AD9F1|nr:MULTISPECIES: hypothetical protein [unclassified Caballeronia]MDR5751088.1 hypothetical protein [Caballeronia sp. LZ024]MDR5844777.1 hypothetical protein [Caballeronia sp. LZ031]
MIEQKELAGYAAANMQQHAERQTKEYREQFGAELAITTKVHVVDGYRAWPTVLASALVQRPELAGGNREQMAVLIQTELGLSNPFTPARLSRELSEKARKVVKPILAEAGYDSVNLTNGLSIRDAVRAGAAGPKPTQTVIETQFHSDGLTLDGRRYVYECIPATHDQRPWYALGIRFGGDLISLKAVLALRKTGVQQFIEFDTRACEQASDGERRTRHRLMQDRTTAPLWTLPA